MKVIEAARRDGVTFLYELKPGDTWTPHPSGNGVIVANPEHKPLWCRIENGVRRQDYIELYAPQAQS